MTSWADGPMIAFDLETTAVDPFEARIASYCVGRVHGANPPDMQTRIVNPGVPMPPGATAVNGITDEMAAAGQPAAEAVAFVAATLVAAWKVEIPVVGWNVSYDLTVLDSELLRHGLPSLAAQAYPAGVAPVVDGFVLDKYIDKWRKGSRKLVAAAQFYGVPIADGTAHDAEVDALAACRIAWVIAKRNPGIGGISLRRLHTLQVGWAQMQADDLRKYFDRKSIPHDGVDPHWPIHHRIDLGATEDEDVSA